MKSISILLVDDNPNFLESAMRFLAMDEHLEVVGLALSGREALEQVEILRPDLVLMDLTMPGLNGLDTTRLLKEKPTSPHIIILTLHDTAQYSTAAQEAKADGFIAKSDFADKLPPLIEHLRVSREEKELASRWHQALFLLSKKFTEASARRDELGVILATALQSALEHMLLKGELQDLHLLEEWLNTENSSENPSQLVTWMPNISSSSYFSESDLPDFCPPISAISSEPLPLTPSASFPAEALEGNLAAY